MSDTGPLPKLSVDEEEEILIEMAVHDWATQSGRTANPEDLVIPRLDPASVEAQRDRALRAEMERQRKFREYRQRNAGQQVAQPQRHGAATPTLWVQAPTAQPFVPGLAPDLDRIATQHSGPGRAAPPEAEPRARKAPGRRAAAKKAPAPADVIEPPAPVSRVRGRRSAPSGDAPVESRAPIEVPPAPAPAKKAATRKAAKKKAEAATPPVEAPAAEAPAIEASAVAAPTEAAAVKKPATRRQAKKKAEAVEAPPEATAEATAPVEAPPAAAKKASQRQAAKKAPAAKRSRGRS